jgi:acyl-coenzyme A thioesterase PaaI-like protein
MGEGSFAPNVEDPAAFFPYSPVIGARNPISPKIEFRVRDGELHAEHSFDAPWCGPPTAVHGGVIALVFDELLGCTNVVNHVGGFTGKLEVRYRALTPLGKPIRLRGWIDRRDGRKTFTKGTMHDGQVLCAEAEGVFIAPDARSLERMGFERKRAAP